MGISFIGYLAAWLLYFILNAIYVWAVMILMLYFGVIKVNGLNFEDGYSFQYLAILYFVYTLSTISFALFLSTFFRKAKIAAQVTSIINIGYGFYPTCVKLLLLSKIFIKLQIKQGTFTFNVNISSGFLQQWSMLNCLYQQLS